MTEKEPWSRTDSRQLVSLVVLVVVIGAIVGFVIFLKHLSNAIGS